jgi:hypothetical protein
MKNLIVVGGIGLLVVGFVIKKMFGKKQPAYYPSPPGYGYPGYPPRRKTRHKKKK